MGQAATTKEQILHAARAEFAEKGIAGARVDAIAAAARINKQRIYAYFGNKENLFSAVLTDAFLQLSDAVPLPHSREELIAYAGYVFDFHCQNPDFNRLLTWEALNFRSGHLPAEAERRHYYEHKVRTIAESFPTVDTETIASLLLELIGLAAWPVLMSPLQRHLHGLQPNNLPPQATTRQFIIHAATALVDSALA